MCVITQVMRCALYWIACAGWSHIVGYRLSPMVLDAIRLAARRAASLNLRKQDHKAVFDPENTCHHVENMRKS